MYRNLNQFFYKHFFADVSGKEKRVESFLMQIKDLRKKNAKVIIYVIGGASIVFQKCYSLLYD